MWTVDGPGVPGIDRWMTRGIVHWRVRLAGEQSAERRERRERRAQSMSRNDDAEDMSDDRFARCFGVLGRCQSRVPVMAVPDAMIAKGGLAYL